MRKVRVTTDRIELAKSLEGDFARPSHVIHPPFEGEDVEVSLWDGYRETFITRLIPACLSEKNHSRAAKEMWKVDTPITNRGAMAGRGSMMERILKDGSISATREIPPAVRDFIGRGDVIGYLAATPRTPRNRLSGYTMRHPEALAAVLPLADEIQDIFHREYPIEAAAQEDFFERDGYDHFDGTSFSSLNVNVDLRSPNHRDASNQPGSWSALFTDGDYTGGGLVLVRYGVCLNVKPRDLVFFRGGEDLHGVTPFTGRRVSGVFFASRNGFTEFWDEAIGEANLRWGKDLNSTTDGLSDDDLNRIIDGIRRGKIYAGAKEEKAICDEIARRREWKMKG